VAATACCQTGQYTTHPLPNKLIKKLTPTRQRIRRLRKLSELNETFCTAPGLFPEILFQSVIRFIINVLTIPLKEKKELSMEMMLY
jgi:hypothetical protein